MVVVVMVVVVWGVVINSDIVVPRSSYGRHVFITDWRKLSYELMECSNDTYLPYQDSLRPSQ
jgi:hypothetical protein